MPKKIFVFLALIVLLSVTLLGYNWLKKDKTNEEAVQQEMEDFSGSMQDLIAHGKSVKCTYGGENNGDKFSGMLYIADNKARQDVEMGENGEITEVHTIVDGKWIYSWTSQDPNKGVKIYIDQTEEELKEFGEDVKETSQQEWQKDFSYKCSKWKVDESKFVLPGDITFMDMSEMMNQAGNMFEGMDEDLPAETDGSEGPDMDDLKKSMCAMCDNALDVEECRANLECD